MSSLPLILMIFLVPLGAALIYSLCKDSRAAKKKVRDEWAIRLEDFERSIGRRLAHEEVKIWLLKAWFRAAWGDSLDEFAREIEKKFLDR